MHTSIARGIFELSTTAEPPYDVLEGVTLGRFTFEKHWTGDLHGTSTVQMLGARTPDEGSAGYVAMERVVGSLGGHTGSFVLQHSGTVTRGVSTLLVSVVPGSGTGGLTGLVGRMTIDIVGGKHTYQFEYSFVAG